MFLCRFLENETSLFMGLTTLELALNDMEDKMAWEKNKASAQIISKSAYDSTVVDLVVSRGCWCHKKL